MNFNENARIEQSSVDTNKTKIILTSVENSLYSFYLRVELINQLVISPNKLLNVIVKNEGQIQNNIICDFSGLRPAYNQPVIKKTNSKEDNLYEEEVISTVDYAITDNLLRKGVTMYLTKNGWSEEERFFSIELRKYVALAASATIKKCVNSDCGKEIKSSSKFCPFCGTKQI